MTCSIQDQIYAGLGVAAQFLGQPSLIYRPTSSEFPLSNQVAALNVAFNAADPSYKKASLYGKPIWYADFDGRTAQPGDYIVRINDGDIWFIADMQFLLPIVAVSCNRFITISRTRSRSDMGAVSYGYPALEPILGTNQTAWPCSLQLGGRALSNDSGLPADVKQGGRSIILPPSVPVTIQAGDVVTDDLKQTYAVESAEQTDMGWRLTANETHL